MPPPTAVRRWHILSPPIRPSASVHGSKYRSGSTSVRGRVRSQHNSGGRQWLSCRQPACLYVRQLRHWTDRRTDRQTGGLRSSKMPPLGREHNNARSACLPLSSWTAASMESACRKWSSFAFLNRCKMSGYERTIQIRDFNS